MKIIYDISIDDRSNIIGTHYVDFDLNHPLTVTGIKGNPNLARPIDAIIALNADKSQLLQAGWLEPTKIPGHPVGITRWDILCAEANKATAAPEVQALKLSALPAVVVP